MVTRRVRWLLIAALLSLFSVGAVAQGIIDWGNHPAEFMGKLLNGELTGVSYFMVSGLNSDIDVASEEDVWDLGGNLNFPAAAEQLYISSSNAADTMNLYIEGLNGSGVEVTETKQLAGLTFTATANIYWRVHRVTAIGATAPAGTVYVHIDSVDGDANGIPDTLQTDTRALISAASFQTNSGFFACPASRTCFVLHPDCGGSVSFTPGLGYLLHRTSAAGPWVRAWRTTSPYLLGQLPAMFALKLDALDEIRFRGKALADNSTFGASALILIYETD